uniref:Uncharacterized protein n=1 Tax=Glossina brevipalpis TaxID=37001 RepID=A0A1A9W017_9MUSC
MKVDVIHLDQVCFIFLFSNLTHYSAKVIVPIRIITIFNTSIIIYIDWTFSLKGTHAQIVAQGSIAKIMRCFKVVATSLAPENLLMKPSIRAWNLIISTINTTINAHDLFH